MWTLTLTGTLDLFVQWKDGRLDSSYIGLVAGVTDLALDGVPMTSTPTSAKIVASLDDPEWCALAVIDYLAFIHRDDFFDASAEWSNNPIEPAGAWQDDAPVDF